MASKKLKVKVSGLGNHPKGWVPTAQDVPSSAPGDSEVSDYGRQEALQPSQADMRAAFGEPIDEGSKVRWSIDMRDKRKRGLYKELSEPRRRFMKERSGRMNGARKVHMTDRVTGESRYFPEDVAEVAGRRGNFRVRSHAMGSRVVMGPDGMLFKDAGAGTWWPTGRKCLGTPIDGSDPYDVYPSQADPSGVLWQLTDGEWHKAGDV